MWVYEAWAPRPLLVQYARSPAAAACCMQIEHIIDLHRYPLTSLGSRAGRALLRSIQRDLRDHGCAVLPRFLQRGALAEGVAECERASYRGQVFAKCREHNVYMSAADAALPAQHPVHRFQSRTQGYIAHDQLEPTSIFRALYAFEPLTSFVCAATSRKLYRSSDPIACAPISVM